MIGTKIQKEYAILMIVVSYLRMAIKDDLEYLEEQKDNLKVKHIKGIKDLISKRRKLIKTIFNEVDANDKPIKRKLIESHINKCKKQLLKALRLNENIRKRKGLETPYTDLDELQYFIIKSLVDRTNKYLNIFILSRDIKNNPYLKEGINIEQIEKTIKFFVNECLSKG